MRLSRDLAAGLVGLGLSVWLYVLSRDLPPKSPFVPIGPEFYPLIVLGVTALLSLALIGGALLDRRRAAVPVFGPGNYRLVALAFLVFFLYVAAIPLVGFRLATLGFVLMLQIVLDPPQTRRRWIVVVAVAVATTAIAYGVFQHYLSVLLPLGRWTGF